jgi:hypothetical protein
MLGPMALRDDLDGAAEAAAAFAGDGERLLGTMADYCAKTKGKRTGDEVDLQVVTQEGERRRVALELG